MDKKCSVESWISLILRLSFVSLFATAAIGKFVDGLGTIVTGFTELFKDTWIPTPLVILHARLIPWLEALIAIWLLLGVRLKEAWVLTALTLISLAFGMVVLKQAATASANYIYVFMACVGLYFSQFDQCNVGNWGKK